MRVNSVQDSRERSYFHVSRGWSMSLVFIMPLVVLYQIGIVQSGSNVRNLAEVWMTGPIALLGLQATTAVNVLLIGGVIIVLWRINRTGPVSILFLVLMVLESLFYAFLLFGVVGIAAGLVDETLHNLLFIGRAAEAIDGLPRTQLLLGIGAGVYEELLFRVLAIGGGALVMKKVFRCSSLFALAFVLPVSSLLFSAAHHVGVAGEPFSSFVFIFRALCGFVLGLIFIARGPGIPVMTHAIYNVMVLLLMHFS